MAYRQAYSVLRPPPNVGRRTKRRPPNAERLTLNEREEHSMSKSRPHAIRVLFAKPGLDGHDRGVVVLVRGLRDAGMEVIYTGLHQTPQAIARAALQEDVDVVAVSVLSGAHLTIFPAIQRALRHVGLTHVLLTGGGIIAEADRQRLARLGVGQLFGPGTSLTTIVSYIKHAVK